MWTQWEPNFALREPAALDEARRDLHDEIERQKFIQFEFERQWRDLKAHCARNGIRLMGDVPIYVALDSADVWAHPELFELAPTAQPRSSPACRPTTSAPPASSGAIRSIAGSSTRKTGYAWWIARFRALVGDARPDPARSLPRLRGVLGNSRRRHDRGEWQMGEGTGRGAV